MDENETRRHHMRNFTTEVSEGRVLYVPKRPRWTATSMTVETDADIRFMREVYVDNGSECRRFVLAPERDWDSEVHE